MVEKEKCNNFMVLTSIWRENNFIGVGSIKEILISTTTNDTSIHSIMTGDRSGRLYRLPWQSPRDVSTNECLSLFISFVFKLTTFNELRRSVV